jgi:hypothetical protein
VAINYTTLFQRVGRFIYVSNQLLAAQNTYRGIGTHADGILDEYADRRDLVDGLLPTFDGLAAQMAAQVLVLKGYVDRTLGDLQAELNTPSDDVAVILPRLYEDMVLNGHTVDASTIGSPSIAAVSGNTGNGSLVASKVDALGRDAETSISEVVRFTCTLDSYDGGTAGGEQFSVVGYPEINPETYGTRGNGNGPTLSVLNEGGGNIPTNAGFDTFSTANTPDSWDIDAPGSGGPGTVIFSEASTVYTAGGMALKLQGNSSTATVTLSQTIASRLDPLTRYVGGVRLRKGAGTFAAGSTLTIRLTNGTTHHVLYSADPSTLTTSYVLHHAFVSTGEEVSSAYELQITWTSASGVASTGQIFIDDLAFGEAYEFGGIFYGLFRGSTNYTVGDAFTSTTSNGYEGTIQTWFGRFYPGFQLPSNAAGAETIDDALAE